MIHIADCITRQNWNTHAATGEVFELRSNLVYLRD